MPLAVLTARTTADLSKQFAAWEQNRMEGLKAEYERYRLLNPKMPPPALMIGSMNMSVRTVRVTHWDEDAAREVIERYEDEFIIIFTHN